MLDVPCISVQCQLALRPRELSSFHPEFVPGRDQLVTPAQAASGFTVLDAESKSLVLATTSVPVRPYSHLSVMVLQSMEIVFGWDG
jgi:hypothetical protein